MLLCLGRRRGGNAKHKRQKNREMRGSEVCGFSGGGEDRGREARQDRRGREARRFPGRKNGPGAGEKWPSSKC
jgi:hypothetical protein